ncbi:M18 family aminopeptidase [Collinsella intestinalis]|uniref:M18 family aminopeptidase n=1 Tax=Collinsella intestinalis TaxID=147207 RepID=UPI001957187E|nr:M18 family aminopeptidase [Collinsella intestinalis]MBM6907018.1 M18 family aminopeptidase [Collinsella intestinalis]
MADEVGTLDGDALAQAQGLMAFIRESPSMFHTAAAVRRRLDAAGFTYLAEDAAWDIEPGGRYYTCRNASSVVAWAVGSRPTGGASRYHFQVAAAHGDSPTFKLKSNALLEGPAGVQRLNVEPYGGMIDYTWFDRPLTLAGRALVRVGGRVESRLVALDGPVALIPSLAVHLDRGVNGGFAPNRARDLCPVIAASPLPDGGTGALVAHELGVAPEDLVSSDLFLVAMDEPRLWGPGDAFLSAPRLDDLMCAYTALVGFLEADEPASVNVYALFDNEEVGSNTKQGALSTLLFDVLARTSASLGLSDEDLRRALARSFMVSCDNAHAVHPNRPDVYDEGNRCRLGGGIVIKEAANQHYCTDAFSRAAMIEVCRRAGVPYQTFANRSDQAGGSTLGNLSNMQASMHGVDVGCAQWAMHSAFETAGAADVALAVRTLSAYFACDLRIEGADGFEVR